MLDNDEFKIQLRVADRVYPVFCKRSEEGLLRKAATAINDKMLQYSSFFSGAKLEAKDLLAMAATHISRESLLLKQEGDTAPLLEKVELLSNELEEYLRLSVKVNQ